MIVASCAVSAQAPPGDKAEALSAAVRAGDVAAVRKLLADGVPVDTKFRYDRTALSFACDRGHLEVVKLLLESGADVNAKDTFYNATPLAWASSPAMARKPQHAEIVGLLLKRGAQGKEAALFAALRAPDVPMAKVVLEQGGLSPETLADALEAAAKSDSSKELLPLLEAAGARPHPSVALSEAQLARYAGAYSDGTTELFFAVKEGRLQGGPAGQVMTFVPSDEKSFRIPGRPGLGVVFTLEGDRASAVTVRQGGTPTVYKRVEGK
jgi:ankyrin repeat protein